MQSAARQGEQGRAITLDPRPGGVLAACFHAMSSPCEILFATSDRQLALEGARQCAAQAWRIEEKFSRQGMGSVVAHINANAGRPTSIDAETVHLLDVAARCHALSDGLFDITCGTLRQAWNFEAGHTLPTPAAIERLLEHVGFDRIERTGNSLVVPVGMEIDLNGLAKEYAVDLALEQLEASTPNLPPVLVNFGGDLRTNRPPASGPWNVGIEDLERSATPAFLLALSKGALATSVDTHRHIEHEGVRYGHILNPHTGWPVQGAPHSVTVAADTCLEAGTLSTIAFLKGAQAEAFLEGTGNPHWCLR